MTQVYSWRSVDEEGVQEVQTLYSMNVTCMLRSRKMDSKVRMVAYKDGIPSMWVITQYFLDYYMYGNH